MFKFIGLLTVLALGFGGGIAWEARPSIGYHLNLLIWHPGFSLPDGWKVQRDKAVEAGRAARDSLATCQANTLSLKGAVTAQNAAVDALRTESEARVAASAKATSAARSVAESFRQQAAVILAAKPTTPDACKNAAALIAEEVR